MSSGRVSVQSAGEGLAFGNPTCSSHLTKDGNMLLLKASCRSHRFWAVGGTSQRSCMEMGCEGLESGKLRSGRLFPSQLLSSQSWMPTAHLSNSDQILEGVSWCIRSQYVPESSAVERVFAQSTTSSSNCSSACACGSSGLRRMFVMYRTASNGWRRCAYLLGSLQTAKTWMPGS